MIVDMKFDEQSLTRYLVNNLKPLTKADPVILAEYVTALLKKDRPIKELQDLCAENLADFLGQGTKSFISKLFQALEDGSGLLTAETLDSIKQGDPSSSITAVDSKALENSPEELSNSGNLSDSEEKEISDDDDDDRNHKHRRRETRSQSSEKDAQETFFRRPFRKRNRPFDNGQAFLENDPQSSGSQKEYNAVTVETDLSAKFERRRLGLGPLPRAQLELGQRNRYNQPIRGEGGGRVDFSTSLGRHPGRGRGRASGPWSQHDSRFNSVNTLDFASQMSTQGPTPGLYAGRGLHNSTNAHTPWGTFGLIPGMSNGGLDALHPLMPGTLRPQMNPPLGIGMPRQRCRDFEERGFCLRGDMCPMEHGVNRIVVEDVQSLSQFNLPVSLPSARLIGKPAGPLPSLGGSSNLTINNKGKHGKNSMPGTIGDAQGTSAMLPVSASVGEADLYDPDQPLLNNGHPEASNALLRLPSPKLDDCEPLWNLDSSDCPNLRLSDGIDTEYPGKSIAPDVSSNATASVWGRIRNSGNNMQATGKYDSTIVSTGYLGNETKADQAEGLPSVSGSTHQRKWTVTEDSGPKAQNSVATQRQQSDHLRNNGRTSQKALRTLFVSGIPLTSNKREALLAHFRKFGAVIDIYIPQNSERAFVQFSTREEAESALKAPDAVMGNRFIKLWWANRDSIPDGVVTSSGNAPSAVPHGMANTAPQSSVADRGKENHPSLGPKDAAVPPVAAAVHSKLVRTNGPTGNPSQKKLENLELLKEQLRLKQEMLDQKRNDFRRQLDKLEKKAVTVKDETTPRPAAKRLKVESVTESGKSGTPGTINPSKSRPGIENMRDKNNPGESTPSPSSKTNSTAVLQSPRSLKAASHPSAPIGTPVSSKRFKLDNRSSTFRLLPPVPADLLNVAALKEHFSSFGDVCTVELEDGEPHISSVCSERSENCSARITFTTRQMAERAFLKGKCWQGHILQLSWLTPSGISCNNSSTENSVTPTAKGLQDAEFKAKNVTSGSPTFTAEKSSCCVSQTAAATRNGETANSEEATSDVKPTGLVETCRSNPMTMSTCETPSLKDHVNVDDLNAEQAK